MDDHGPRLIIAEAEQTAKFMDCGVLVLDIAEVAELRQGPLAVVYADGPVDVPALITHCNARLADFKVPRYVAVRDEPLPRLATQKISKPALRDEYRNAQLSLPKVR